MHFNMLYKLTATKSDTVSKKSHNLSHSFISLVDCFVAALDWGLQWLWRLPVKCWWWMVDVPLRHHLWCSELSLTFVFLSQGKLPDLQLCLSLYDILRHLVCVASISLRILCIPLSLFFKLNSHKGGDPVGSKVAWTARYDAVKCSCVAEKPKRWA